MGDVDGARYYVGICVHLDVCLGVADLASVAAPGGPGAGRHGVVFVSPDKSRLRKVPVFETTRDTDTRAVERLDRQRQPGEQGQNF